MFLLLNFFDIFLHFNIFCHIFLFLWYFRLFTRKGVTGISDNVALGIYSSHIPIAHRTVKQYKKKTIIEESFGCFICKAIINFHFGHSKKSGSFVVKRLTQKSRSSTNSFWLIDYAISAIFRPYNGGQILFDSCLNNYNSFCYQQAFEQPYHINHTVYGQILKVNTLIGFYCTTEVNVCHFKKILERACFRN